MRDLLDYGKTDESLTVTVGDRLIQPNSTLTSQCNVYPLSPYSTCKIRTKPSREYLVIHTGCILNLHDNGQLCASETVTVGERLIQPNSTLTSPCNLYPLSPYSTCKIRTKPSREYLVIHTGCILNLHDNGQLCASETLTVGERLIQPNSTLTSQCNVYPLSPYSTCKIRTKPSREYLVIHTGCILNLHDNGQLCASETLTVGERLIQPNRTLAR